MSTHVEIRHMSRGDIEAVRDQFTELDRLHRAALPWRFRDPGHQPRGLHYFEGLLADEHTTILVAVEQGQVVGFIHAAVREAPAFELFVPQKSCLIDNLHVASHRRRLGIGRALVEAAEAWGSQLGATGSELMVYEFNQAARRFFAELGYSVLARRMIKRP
jgi:diamine N-acetyltransferase